MMQRGGVGGRGRGEGRRDRRGFARGEVGDWREEERELRVKQEHVGGGERASKDWMKYVGWVRNGKEE